MIKPCCEGLSKGCNNEKGQIQQKFSSGPSIQAGRLHAEALLLKHRAIRVGFQNSQHPPVPDLLPRRVRGSILGLENGWTKLTTVLSPQKESEHEYALNPMTHKEYSVAVAAKNILLDIVGHSTVACNCCPDTRSSPHPLITPSQRPSCW